jgi:hypothetical protein
VSQAGRKRFANVFDKVNPSQNKDASHPVEQSCVDLFSRRSSQRLKMLIYQGFDNLVAGIPPVKRQRSVR